MSEIWNFSPSLQPQVELCLSVAIKNEPNKWQREFSHFKLQHNLEHSGSNESITANGNTTKKNPPLELSDEENLVETVINTRNTPDCEKITELYESLESDLSSYIVCTIQECIKNFNLLHSLATRLSTTTIEKLCKYIYDTKDIDNKFITAFFKYFIPTYIKREYNCLTLDLLIRANKIYPSQFKILLSTIIKDVEIPSKILQDYVPTLNENDKTKLILDIAELDLTSEEFSHNLFAVYIAYKDAVKSMHLQKIMQTILSQYANFAATDRNFGRLLLAFLQSHKNTCTPIDASIERILEVHKSPFKRPCVTLFNELRNKHDESIQPSSDSE